MNGGHYLSRDPGGFLPWLALCGNILLLVFLLVQVRGARESISVGFAASQLRVPAAGRVAQLKQGAMGGWELDGRLLADRADMEKRLAVRASDASSIVVRTGPAGTAGDLADVLRICSQAGFTSVRLEKGE